MREQGVALKHHGRVPLIRRLGRDILASDKQFSGRGDLKAGDHAQSRGLAAAGRAKKGNEFTGRDFQGDIIHRPEHGLVGRNIFPYNILQGDSFRRIIHNQYDLRRLQQLNFFFVDAEQSDKQVEQANGYQDYQHHNGAQGAGRAIAAVRNHGHNGSGQQLMFRRDKEDQS